jgi:hypothetical protein
MAKTAGMGDAFYFGGSDVSGDINSFSNIGGGPAAGDGTDITMSAVARLALERDGRMSFVSFFDPVTAHPVLSALPTADVVMSYFRGRAIGNPSACMVGKQPNYDGNRGGDGSLMFTCDAIANGSGLEWGVQLTPGIRTDTSATIASSANSFDTGAAAAFGAQIYVHLFAFAGTSVTIEVRDSTDNITFGAIGGGGGFPTTAWTSAPQAMRIVVPNTTTVNRYIAVRTTGTFTNAQFAVTVHKNEIAGVVF